MMDIEPFCLYCFGCQSSHLHHWIGGKWRCPNREFTRKDPLAADTPAIDPDTAAALAWAGAGADEALREAQQ